MTGVFCITNLLLAALLTDSSVLVFVEEIGTSCNRVWSTYLTRIHRALGTSTLLCLLTNLSLSAQTIAESIHLVGVLAGVFRLTRGLRRLVGMLLHGRCCSVSIYLPSLGEGVFIDLIKRHFFVPIRRSHSFPFLRISYLNDAGKDESDDDYATDYNGYDLCHSNCATVFFFLLAHRIIGRLLALCLVT